MRLLLTLLLLTSVSEAAPKPFQVKITRVNGRAASVTVFQSSLVQKMITKAVCALNAEKLKKLCKDGSMFLRLSALRFTPVKGGYRVRLVTNLGTFWASNTVGRQALFSGKELTFRFPKTKRSFEGGKVRAEASGQMRMKFEKPKTRFYIEQMSGDLKVIITIMGFEREDTDKAELTNLITTRMPH